MDKDGWDDVDGCIHRQRAQVRLWHEGEEVGAAAPSGM